MDGSELAFEHGAVEEEQSVETLVARYSPHVVVDDAFGQKQFDLAFAGQAIEPGLVAAQPPEVAQDLAGVSLLSGPGELGLFAGVFDLE